MVWLFTFQRVKIRLYQPEECIDSASQQAIEACKIHGELK